jgi:hypothetical protein
VVYKKVSRPNKYGNTEDRFLINMKNSKTDSKSHSHRTRKNFGGAVARATKIYVKTLYVTEDERAEQLHFSLFKTCVRWDEKENSSA